MTEERSTYDAGQPVDPLTDIKDVLAAADEIGQTAITFEVKALRWLVAEVGRLRKLVAPIEDK